MRKQNKYIYTGVLVTAGITAIIDVLLQNEKLKKNGEKLTWQNYNGFQTMKRMAVFGIVGGIVGNEFYESEFKEEIKKPFSSDDFLKTILNEDNVQSDPEKLNELISIKNEVKDTLYNQFSDQLICFPEDVGSLQKKTAICPSYDSDIILAIKRENQFGTLNNMSEVIHNTIEDIYGKKNKVIKNKKATTIVFKGFEGYHNVDIVYGREIKNYNVDKKLNLYVRPAFFWQDGGRFKTDVGIQKHILVNQPKAREIVKAFKTYFNRNNFQFENTLLEQLILEAHSSNNYVTESSISNNFLNSMDYVSQKLQNRVIKDYANSNNNLLNKISETNKQAIINLINSDLKKVTKNSHYIKEIFHT